MPALEIKKGIYWVGAKDWNVRDFHGYNTERGTSYNAYLIIDKKIVLIDTVKTTHYHEMLSRIESIIDPSKIDIVVCNHVEMDHSGSLPQILEKAPNAEVITSPNGEKGLQAHFDTSGWKIKQVNSNETINIGQRNLSFVLTPMIHWPDSMVTYIPEEKLLLPNDAFGQHLAIDHLFDDQNPKDIIMDEAAKYYANIVYPYGAQVKKALETVGKLEIDMIAPSHGIIWRKYLADIINNYGNWANHHNYNKAIIVYDSMWGSTEKLAQTLSSTLEKKQIPVSLRCLKYAHISDVIKDILEARYVFIGSPALNSTVLPTMGSFLTYLKGLKPKNKIGLAFGSYGWNTSAQKEIEQIICDLGWDNPQPAISIKYRPRKSDLDAVAEIVENIYNKSSNLT